MKNLLFLILVLFSSSAFGQGVGQGFTPLLGAGSGAVDSTRLDTSGGVQVLRYYTDGVLVGEDTISTPTDTNIGENDLTLTGARTLDFNNNELTLLGRTIGNQFQVSRTGALEFQHSVGTVSYQKIFREDFGLVLHQTLSSQPDVGGTTNNAFTVRNSLGSDIFRVQADGRSYFGGVLTLNNNRVIDVGAPINGTDATRLSDISRGQFNTITTDANGLAIIPHTFAAVPTAIVPKARGPVYYHIQVTAKSTTDFAVKVFDSDGTPAANESFGMETIMSFQ